MSAKRNYKKRKHVDTLIDNFNVDIKDDFREFKRHILYKVPIMWIEKWMDANDKGGYNSILPTFNSPIGSILMWSFDTFKKERKENIKWRYIAGVNHSNKFDHLIISGI
jgi:hypothetical protein